jgi:hypothetical protein
MIRKIGLILLGGGFLAITSCNKANELPARNCIHCTGCFNSWDECKEDYHQDSLHPYTWEQYVDSVFANNQNSTNQCHWVE